MHGQGASRELSGLCILDVRSEEVNIKLLMEACYRKGFINTEDLKDVFSLLGENVSDDEVSSKDKVQTNLYSNDKDRRCEVE